MRSTRALSVYGAPLGTQWYPAHSVTERSRQPFRPLENRLENLENRVTPLRAERRSRRPVTEQVRRCQVVPRAARTDLNDVHPELAVFTRHQLQLARCSDAPLERAELVAVDVGQLNQLGASTKGTGPVCGDAMVLGRPQEV